MMSNMKSKNLANVLIKIIGLYVCLCAIPGIISGGLIILTSPYEIVGSRAILSLIGNAIGHAVQAAIGIILVVKSRALAGYWFENDDV
jgi:hypothetical protein